MKPRHEILICRDCKMLRAGPTCEPCAEIAAWNHARAMRKNSADEIAWRYEQEKLARMAAYGEGLPDDDDDGTIK